MLESTVYTKHSCRSRVQCQRCWSKTFLDLGPESLFLFHEFLFYILFFGDKNSSLFFFSGEDTHEYFCSKGSFSTNTERLSWYNGSGLSVGTQLAVERSGHSTGNGSVPLLRICQKVHLLQYSCIFGEDLNRVLLFAHLLVCLNVQ